MSILDEHPAPWTKECVQYSGNVVSLYDGNNNVIFTPLWSGHAELMIQLATELSWEKGRFNGMFDFADKLQGQVNSAVEILKEFIGAYPGGINPDLDAACNKARDFLKS